MTALDVLILLPVLPAAPVIITWWLPWEKWLWEKVPKKVLAPYLCYLTFVAWHFRLHWWAVLGAAVWAFLVGIAAIKEAKHESDGKKL